MATPPESESATRSPESSRASLTEAGRALLLAAGKELRLSTDELLFERGSEGEDMYLVEEGRIRLVFDEGKQGKVLEAGALFGEIALLARGSRRTATAVAVEPCRLRALGQDALDELVASNPTLICSLLRQTCATLVRSEQQLSSGLRERNEELERALDYLRRTKDELDGTELLAHTDELTGLYNRRCLVAQFPKFVERARQAGTQLALLLIDLDRFKPINDTHGHAAGDSVLRSVGLLLRRSLGASELPCRLGGDEFAILLSDVNAESAPRRAALIHREVNGLRVTLPKLELEVAASMGGVLRREGDGLLELLVQADANLYLAKRGGRCRLGWEGVLLETLPGDAEGSADSRSRAPGSSS